MEDFLINPTPGKKNKENEPPKYGEESREKGWVRKESKGKREREREGEREMGERGWAWCCGRGGTGYLVSRC
jgi:hypothetical protein